MKAKRSSKPASKKSTRAPSTNRGASVKIPYKIDRYYPVAYPQDMTISLNSFASGAYHPAEFIKMLETKAERRAFRKALRSVSPMLAALSVAPRPDTIARLAEEAQDWLGDPKTYSEKLIQDLCSPAAIRRRLP